MLVSCLLTEANIYNTLFTIENVHKEIVNIFPTKGNGNKKTAAQITSSFQKKRRNFRIHLTLFLAATKKLMMASPSFFAVAAESFHFLIQFLGQNLERVTKLELRISTISSLSFWHSEK